MSSFIKETDQIILEKATFAKLAQTKSKRRLSIFEAMFKSPGIGYFQRSRKLFLRDRFYKSKNYNHLKSTYSDRLKIMHRSKSVDFFDQISQESDESEDSNLPKHSYLTLFRIVAIAFSMENLWSIQEALTVPLLLKLKISEKFYSLVYMLAPLVGFFLQPVIGVLSDRCQSSFGPRRPFIFFLSLMSLAGSLSLLLAPEIGDFIQSQTDLDPNLPIFGIAFACLGVSILTFSTDSTNNSDRALIIDNCNQEDQDSALSFMSLLSAVGMLSGYILGAINWENTFLKVLGNDRIIISIISSVIVIVSLVVTLTSIKETPLDFEDEDDDNKDKEKKPLIPVLEYKRVSSFVSLKSSIDDEILRKNIQKFDKKFEDDEDEPITLGLLYKSVLNMPKELLRLLVCHILGWMSIWSFSLFYTDYIAQVIYKGDPVALPGSSEFEAYNKGVQMGCWGLAITTIVNAVSAVILERYLIDYFDTKTLYFWSTLIHAISAGLLYFQTNIYIIYGLSSAFGIMLNVVLVLPYQMISEFHQCDVYRSKSSEGTKRGIGIDCALLSSVYFLAQTLVASFTSLLTSNFGNSVILLTSSFFAFMSCFWIALFVIFPEVKQEERASEDSVSITLTI